MQSMLNSLDWLATRLMQRLTFIYSRTFSIPIPIFISISANLLHTIWCCQLSFQISFQLTSSSLIVIVIVHRLLLWFIGPISKYLRAILLICLHCVCVCVCVGYTYLHMCAQTSLSALLSGLLIRRAKRANCHALCAHQGGSDLQQQQQQRTLYLSSATWPGFI